MSAPAGAGSLLQPRILAAFLGVSAIWGSTWIVIKDQLGEVPPTWSVAYRFLLAAAIMGALALFQRARLRFTAREHGFAALIGLSQFVLNFNFVYRAEAHITSGLVAVLFALLIVPNVLIGRWWLGTPVTRRFLLGAGIALVGVGLMIAHEVRAAELGPRAVWWGTGLTLLGVLAASVSNVLQGTAAARRHDLSALLAWAMAWGALGNVVWALATAGPPVFEPRWSYVAGVAYLALFGSAVAFSLYFAVIRAVGPGPAAWTSVLTPVVAMALSTAFEGYRWSALAVAGAATVLVGLAVALRPSRAA